MTQDNITLSLEPRKVFGKAVKHLRQSGQIPAVIHDHGKPSLVVQAEQMSLLKVWKEAGKHHPIELTTGEQNYTALIKEAVFDPKRHQLTHVVFNAVDKNQKVEADIPIRPHYDEGNESSPAERSGFIVLSQLETVSVRAIASKLPDFLEYNAEQLVEVGDHVTVADLIVPNGVEVETETEHSIATVYEPSALAAANDAAGGSEEEAAETEAEGEAGVEDADAGEKKPEAESAESPTDTEKE